MQPISLYLLIILISLCYPDNSQANRLPTSLKGDYLGQTPPGLTPKVFAPAIVSTEGWEYGVVFAPNMKEMYFLREVMRDNAPFQEFVMFERTQNQWHEKIISRRIGTPTLSPDNNTMFFGRGYKTRTDTGWSEMKRLGADFEAIPIMRVTSSSHGTIAFDEASKGSNSILRFATKENGQYTTPKPFPKTINTGEWNAHPFIAPDESYVIWDGQRNSPVRNADLFISFKQPDGSWSYAIKMGKEINTPASEFAAQITPDGKYLFFNRSSDDGNLDTFWVDARVLDKLRPSNTSAHTRLK
ncbi:hypothetical protein [Alteromonas sp. ASW11-130]|uniref:hypothetical protein n=1 Tax=Alteromonas sp. ASW11-130 TaxID=3015775 RepID=UPI002241EFB8|nr:hypothetical protein [Alteromonas sp. ASW11-130]MCW8093288.1 hypothetical protein [Alteromonas sp. ASW11-130]